MRLSGELAEDRRRAPQRVRPERPGNGLVRSDWLGARGFPLHFVDRVRAAARGAGP